MVTSITFVLGICMDKVFLEREWCIQSFKELCVVVSYAVLQTESLGLCILHPIFVWLFSAKDKNIDIYYGGGGGLVTHRLSL